MGLGRLGDQKHVSSPLYKLSLSVHVWCLFTSLPFTVTGLWPPQHHTVPTHFMAHNSESSVASIGHPSIHENLLKSVIKSGQKKLKMVLQQENSATLLTGRINVVFC